MTIRRKNPAPPVRNRARSVMVAELYFRSRVFESPLRQIDPLPKCRTINRRMVCCRCAAYWPFPSSLSTPFGPSPARRDTTPSADFYRRVRVIRITLSHGFVTYGRPPKVSSTAFRASPPNLRSAPLMEMGFAEPGALAPALRDLISGSCSPACIPPCGTPRRITTTTAIWKSW